MTTPLDAVVVGAGQAGLGASYHLRRRGLSHVVLERGRIGETWRSQRWDSFALNTPNWANGLPGAPYDGDAPDGFMLRDEWVERLEAYAARFDLFVSTGVSVTAVEQGRRTGSFLVHTDRHRPETLEAANVVIASGMLRKPKIPPAAERLPAGIGRFHTADYRSPDRLPPGAVLIVGSGQSGVQIAEDLLSAGRRVYLSVSKVGRVPRRYRGRDLFEWLHDMGLLDQSAEAPTDPSVRFAPQPQASGVGRRGHSVSLQLLAERGALLLGHLEGVDGERLVLADNVAEYVRFADETSRRAKKDVDDYLAAHGIEAPAPEDDPGDRPHPDPASLRSPAAVDLGAAGISSVIWCTGFTADFAWIDLPAFDTRGAPRHRGGISDVPGLYFLGFPWLRTRKSGLICGIDEDAAHLVEHLWRRRGGAA